MQEQLRCHLGRYFLWVQFCLVPSVYAQEVPVNTVANQEELRSLKKIQAAAQQLSYQGTFVYQQGVHMRASRITHVANGTSELEKLEILDGRQREYIRNNDEVTRYMPDAKTVLIEKRLTRDVFPAILVANTEELPRYYRVQLGENDRVAGRSCQIISLLPIDKYRYGYRLCTDHETGLLLRAQTLDATRSVVEQILFTQVDIGKVPREKVKTSFTEIGDWQVKRATVEQQSNSASWGMQMPPGFKQVQAVRHILSNKHVQNAGAGAMSEVPREVEQIVLSDGLAAISVFIEADDSGKSASEVQQGAMHIIGRRYGQYWLTVMGEAPDVAVRQVINSMKLIRR